MTDCKFFFVWLLAAWVQEELEEDWLRGAAQIKGEGVKSNGGSGVAKMFDEKNKFAAM